jgi:cytochrome P450
LFKPERFLDEKMSMSDLTTQADPYKRDHFAFGAGTMSQRLDTEFVLILSQNIGRRICPGIQIAEQDMFLALSRLLWAFDFSPPPRTQIDTDQSAFFGETVRRPKPFQVVITPRSERRVATIEREMEIAKQNVFSLYGSYKCDELPGFDK